MKYNNIVNMNDWTVSELQEAIKHYNWELTRTHDDQEHSWFLRTITKCEMRIDELNGTESDWLSLFN